MKRKWVVRFRPRPIVGRCANYETPSVDTKPYTVSNQTQDMASKTAGCGIPSCRVMWAVSVITLAPVAGLLLWPAVNAGAENLTDDEPDVFTGCVPLNQSDTGAENLTDGEPAAFTGCVPVGKLKDVIEAMQVEPLSRDAVYVGSATLVGLAIFGSLIGIRTRDVIKSKIWYLQIGVPMLIIGPYALAITHAVFIFEPNPEQSLWFVVPVSISSIFVTVTGYVLVELGRASEQTGHHQPIR